jgi:Xaa-Pro aminopeptidase
MEKILKSIPGSFLLYSGNYDFDNEIFPFQVNNNFFYLTNIEIPNLAILYNSNSKKINYFCNFNKIWHDNNNIIKKLKSKIYNINTINNYLKNIKKIYTLNNLDTLPIKLDVKCNISLIDTICNESRVIKNISEINNIKKACKISSYAIIDIIKNVKNFENEKDIVYFFKKRMLDHNIEKMAYLPICSNGKNNSILHYSSNNKKIRNSNLILLDIGCKYNNYCCDITRTFPKSGKFSVKQKKIYEIVLKCQKYAIEQLKDGIDWKKLEISIRLLMYDLLLKLNLVFDKIVDEEKIEVTKLFMPHKLGHTIGLNTHDSVPNGKLKILKQNMVITIEPGIYFNKELINLNKSEIINMKEIKKYIKIGGVRIEDTILINKNNCSILSKIPKEIVEIENII